MNQALDNGRLSTTRLLGRGGMAEVFEAYDHTLGVWRAVKFVLPQLAEKPAVLRRFRDEGHAMARVEHPHVLRIYDVGEHEGRPYLLMELATGGSIGDYLDVHERMDPRLALQAILQVCEGVQAAHDEGIIHRDLKPENILVDGRGRCKVTDFGIAQIAQGPSQHRTRTGSIMGSLAYMAPEQRVDAKNVGPAADVYALAATLSAMLTGAAPNELFMAAHHPHMLDGVPEPLIKPLLAALTFDPKQRTATVQGFATELRAVQDALPPRETDPPPLATKAYTPSPLPNRSTPIAATEGATAPRSINRHHGADTLEPDEVAALLPGILENLAVDLHTQEAAFARDQKRIAARAELEAIQSRKSTQPSPERELEPAEATRVQGTPRPATATTPPQPRSERNLLDAGSEADPMKPILAVVDMIVSGPLKPFAVTLGLFSLPVGFVLISGSSAINHAATALTLSSEVLLQTIRSEKGVLDDLAYMGEEPVSLRLQLIRLEAQDGVAQRDLALTYVSGVVGRVMTARPSEHAQEQTLRAREQARRLDAAASTFFESRRVYTELMVSPRGRVVCGLGLAQCDAI